MSLGGGKRRPSIFDEAAKQRRLDQLDQWEHGQRNGAPKPFRPEDGGNTPCPNCGLGGWADSVYCGQCGQEMDDPGHYRQDAFDTVVCPGCLSGNRPVSIFCDQCGRPLPASAYAQADQAKEAKAYGVPGVWGPGTSSSAGRQPGLSPAERNVVLAERNAEIGQQAQRADLLSGYRPGDGDPLIFELGRAERLVKSAESDLEYAQQFLRDAKADFPGDVETARGRYLDPDARSRYDHYCAAQAGVAAALAALQAAQRVQSELLAEYDDISRAFQLGRVPDVI